jgi:hypothetical protein
VGKTHSNGDTYINGSSVQIDIAANAVGSMTISGSPAEPVEGFNAGVLPVPIPDVVPQDYKDMATYVLTSTGKILNPDGSVAGTAGSGSFSAFNFSSGKWQVSGGATSPAGCFYVEGDFKVSGSGSQPTRVMTIIAEGSVETAGNVMLEPYHQGTLILAGRDVKLSGNSGAAIGASSACLVAAHEQVQISGNPKINGVVLGKNAEDLSATVSTSSKIEDLSGTVGGSVELIYNGGLQTILENPAQSVSIQNLRRLK